MADPETASIKTSLEGPPRQVHLPDWTIDPANAKNWSTPKKLYNTAVPSLLCFLMSVRPVSDDYR
ncbi:hypothetical protein PHISCL_09819 [Aspergillus sclerotialis]|uniref:Uncharacterized protein n=1 Tax=Aspergillus sclerotialis TaxID=2070753 RepID=A0A3A2ZEU2_9EURO|nr:hypothetical protein PHISCL_09819 [Aspergillus sclerotialis]